MNPSRNHNLESGHDFQEQVTIFQAPSNDHPASAVEVSVEQAIDRLNANQPRHALSILNHLAGREPRVSNLEYLRAIALARCGDSNNAIQTLESLLAKSPTHSKARVLLAQLQPKVTDRESAPQSSRTGKRLDPTQLDWKGLRFLDPTGRVFEHEGEFYRAVYPSAEPRVRNLFRSGIVEKLVERKLLVETEITDLEVPGYALVLHHRRFPFDVRAPEWNRSLLRDAALGVLDLNLELLRDGMGTIDYHASNVLQQNGCIPSWLDFGSICPLTELNGEPRLWGIAEFLQHFVHPLALHAKHADLGPVARTLLKDGGIPSKAFHALTGSNLKLPVQTREAWLSALRNWLAGLKFPPLGSTWEQYHKDHRLAEGLPTPDQRRQSRIYSILEKLNPRRVVDLGCNAGYFSYLACRLGAEVCAVDFDEGALERLYRIAREQQPTPKITVALRDLIKPNSTLSGDLAMGLALTHHLSISRNYPFSWIAEMLASYTTDALITEFMPYGLGGNHPVPDPLPDHYRLENFRESFTKHFREVEVIDYPLAPTQSKRILVVCRGKIAGSKGP